MASKHLIPYGTLALTAVASLKAVWRHPRLWAEAIRSLLEVRKRGSLFPSRAYLGWRNLNAEGDIAGVVSPTEMRHFLEWRRRVRRR